VDQIIFPHDVRRPPGRPPSVRICGTMDGEREVIDKIGVAIVRN